MYKKKYHKFTEQLVFAIVMRDASLCKELVERIIPDRKVREIRFAENPVMDALAKSIADTADLRAEKSTGWMTAETEKVLIPALLSKSVRFDALFEDDDAWFDIEMQVDSEADMPLRIRYYQASKTITSLNSGDDYRDLKPGYVIFICMFDYFQKGEAVYRFQNLEENLHLPLNDKQFTIILNLTCSEEKIPEILRSFYRYVNHGDAGEDAFTQRIKHLVDRANESAEVQNMITYAGDVAAKEKKLEAMMKQMSEELAQKEARAKAMSEELAQKEARAKELELKLEAANLQTARKLKEQGVSIEIIISVTGLEAAVVESL